MRHSLPLRILANAFKSTAHDDDDDSQDQLSNGESEANAK